MLLNHNNEAITYYAVVRYLKPSKNQPHPNIECPFTMYDWEYNHIGRGHTRPTVLIQMINVESIASVAFITPVMSTKRNSPDYNNPLQSDLFWYMDRKFCDRAGWDEINRQMLIV